MGRTLSGPQALATVLFFFSGALGLAYELVWIRKATLLVGASQIALATVLTSFFLGLGLGSFVVGRYPGSRRWSPLFVYGFFEVGVGLFAVLFPALFEGVEAAYGRLYPLFEASAGGLFLLRFSLLFGLFLVPTFFMGGTLPLLLDVVERDRSIGSVTGLLYGVNILGAVTGVLLTSYLAIPLLGMKATSVLGGIGNLLIGLVALVAFRRASPVHGREGDEEARRGFRPGRRYVVLGFASGLVAIGYQVAWARYFGLFNTGTVYLTAILLAVFLLALATGSLIVAPLLARRVEPLRLVARLQPLAALSAIYGLEAWRAAAYRLSMIGNTGELLESHQVVASWYLFNETVDAIFLAPLLQVGLSIFIPVTLLGTALPSLIAASARRSEELREASGTIVFANTLGASAGGFLTAYVLIPLLGLSGTLGALAVGSVGIGMAAAWADPSTTAARASRLVSFGCCLIGAVLLVPPLVTSEDVTRRTLRLHGWGSNAPEDRLVDVSEGPLTTAYVFDGKHRRSIGSGNVCLAVVEYEAPSTQAIQGHIPALFHPADEGPRTCLGIGLGSGQSFGALLLYPIARLDVVDISREMVDLSLAHFAEYNHGLDTDPRVRFHLDDGRHFVARAAAASYDVVSMEPPPPTTEGAHTLYSLEFYQEVKRILRDKGVFMQWLPLYRVTPADAAVILKTQAAVFPHTFLFKVGRMDFMVVSFAGTTPPRLSLARIRERSAVFATERLVERMRWGARSEHDMSSLEGVLSLIMAGPEEIAAMEAPFLGRDDDAQLSYSSGDRELLRRYEGPYLAMLTFAALPQTPFERLARFFDEPIPAAELDRERARSLALFGASDPDRLAEAIHAFDAASDPATKVRLAVGIAAAYDSALAKEDAMAWVTKGLAVYPQAAAPEWLAAARRIVRNRVAVYEKRVRGWLESLDDGYRGAPMLEAMRDELSKHDAHERELRARYLIK